MGFSLTSREFAEYLKRTAAKIAENKDYITELDAAKVRKAYLGGH